MNLMEMSKAAGYSEPLSRETNQELLVRLQAGDDCARNELIQGNMAMVIVKVDAAIRKLPAASYFRDDLIGHGLLTLIEAVDRLRNPSVSNPTSYLYSAIELALMDVIDEEGTVKVPARSKLFRHRKGKPIPPFRRLNLTLEQAVFNGLEAPDPLSLIELEEEIEACCRDELDLAIVRKRSEGSNDCDIAKALDIPDSTICDRRNRIFQRLIERCPEYK